MAKNEVVIRFLGDSKGFDKVIKGVEGQTTGFNAKVSKGFSGLKVAAGLAFAGAGAAAIGFGKSLLQAGSDGVKVTRQTEAVLKSMGDVAGVTSQQVIGLSEALARKTGVDDEVIQSSQNVMLTFGKVRNVVGEGNDVFTRATKSALDMSVALGTDMKGATIQIGKALNDPIKGITALSRAGVSFTEQQKDQIKALALSGDSLGAQKIILAELEKQFGGSAEAQATAGSRLAATWEILKGELGEKLLPVAEKVATFLAEKLPGAMAFAEDAFGAVGEAGSKVGAVLNDTVFPPLKKVFGFVMDHKELLVGVAVAIGVGLVSAFVSWAVAAGAAAVATIAATLPIIAIGAAIAALVAGIIWAYKNWELFRVVANAAVSAVKTLVTTQIAIITGVLGGLGRILSSVWDGFKSAAKTAFTGIKALWNSTIGKLSFKVPNWVPGIGGKGWSVPKMHTGGVFRAPTPGGEGLALLRDREVVSTPGQALRGGMGGGLTIVVQTGQALSTDRDIEEAVRRAVEGVLARGGSFGDGRGRYLRPA